MRAVKRYENARQHGESLEREQGHYYHPSCVWTHFQKLILALSQGTLHTILERRVE